MNVNKELGERGESSVGQLVSRYLAFVGMFIGAGFISGSIVHLGEGINLWDVSLLVVGVLFFLGSTAVQEFVFNKKSITEINVLQFLAYSLVLSIGVGMASGGIQHFVDTPLYSSYLIPLGLGLGVIAFLLKEKETFVPKRWLQIVGGVAALTLILIWLLGQIAHALPESLLQKPGHNHSSEKELPHEDSAHSHDSHAH